MIRTLVFFIAATLVASAAALTGGQSLPSIFPFDRSYSGDWLVSDWPAGQTALVTWDPANVRPSEDGKSLEMVLSTAEEGADRPYLGAEFLSQTYATTGRWAWEAQAPRMTEGAVFGLFLYRADHNNDPWREYDFEFVGSDTTQVQLNIHFSEEPRDGSTSLGQARGGPVIVDLGFDAADAPHIYEIEVLPGRAIFRIDGDVVGDFTAEDMPGGMWKDGPLRSFANLWAVAPAQEAWAGKWTTPAEPLVGKIYGISLPEPDPAPPAQSGAADCDPDAEQGSQTACLGE